jgi:hypothetical protein
VTILYRHFIAKVSDNNRQVCNYCHNSQFIAMVRSQNRTDESIQQSPSFAFARRVTVTKVTSLVKCMYIKKNNAMVAPLPRHVALLAVLILAECAGRNLNDLIR